MHSRSTNSDGEIRSRAVITGDMSGRVGRHSDGNLSHKTRSRYDPSRRADSSISRRYRKDLAAVSETRCSRGNEDSGRIRLCRPGSPCEILGGGAPLPTTGSARGLRVLGRALESHGSARSRLEQRERDRRFGKTRTPDLLPADGHAKTEEEPGPSGPQYLGRKQDPHGGSDEAGRRGGRAAGRARSDETKSLGRLRRILGGHAGSGRQRVLRPVTRKSR